MKFFRGVIGLLLAAFVQHAAWASGISNGEVRVVVMTDMTGIYHDWGGQGQVIAAQMAIQDQRGEVLGKPIKLIVADSKLDAKYAVSKEAQLYKQQHVDAIVGFTGSNVALPVQAYARDHDIVTLVTGANSTGLTGRDCSPTGVHWTSDTYALAKGAAQAMIAGGKKKWYFITADYAFGRILEEETAQAVDGDGGTVLGNAYAKYKGTDFSHQLALAQASHASVVALADAGKDTQNTIRQAYELGMQSSGQDVIGLLMFITDIRSLGMYVTSGLKFVTAFYWNYNDQTRRWSRRFYKRVGAMPTMAQAGTYSALTHYFEAIKAAGTDEGRAVVKEMKKLPVHDFFAPNGYVREDGRMVHNMYLVEVKRPDQETEAWDYLKVMRVIPAAKAWRPLDKGGCPFVMSAKR